MPEDASRIEELRSQVNEHLYRYHVLDDPIISDAQFDALIAELRRIEEENPELVTPDSPTQRVGAPVGDLFAPVRHLRPLFSLDNADSSDMLLAWEQRMERQLRTSSGRLRRRAQDRWSGGRAHLPRRCPGDGGHER